MQAFAAAVIALPRLYPVGCIFPSNHMIVVQCWLHMEATPAVPLFMSTAMTMTLARLHALS